MHPNHAVRIVDSFPLGGEGGAVLQNLCCLLFMFLWMFSFSSISNLCFCICMFRVINILPLPQAFIENRLLFHEHNSILATCVII
jgi:hypothetical protein